jgi:hypothetical protein
MRQRLSHLLQRSQFTSFLPPLPLHVSWRSCKFEYSITNMKSILDKATRNGLIDRINQLDENSTAQWGQMNVYQMLRHCVLCDELYQVKLKHKRSFMGRLFGKAALKNLLEEDKPFPRNAPTSDVFKAKEKNGNVESEKKKWIALIEAYENYSNDYVHWFFGKMSKEKLGQFVYKHNDHHLQQFGV